MAMTASINDNIIMGDDSYDAFLNILEGDRNRSVTVDSPPAVERGEVLNPAGGFVSHGLLSSLNSTVGNVPERMIYHLQMKMSVVRYLIKADPSPGGHW